MRRFAGPVPLDKSHDFLNFDCGREPLNAFLTRHALASQAGISARTFVALDDNSVVGYYSLAASAVKVEEAPSRMAKGLARHPIPVILNARLAVDRNYQGAGIGAGLFKDALKRCLNVSREIGARALIVHAKDEDAKLFYERFGMSTFPVAQYHLYLLMKDVERSLGLY